MKAGAIDEASVSRVIILISFLALFFAVAVWVLFDWSYSGSEKLEPITFQFPETANDAESDGQYVNAATRPLFWPSRRAPTAESIIEPLQNGGELEGDFKFVGVMIRGSDRQAMLTSKKQFYKVVEGDKLQNWTVQKVTPSSILLVSENGELELTPSKDNTDKIDIKPVN